MEEKKTNMNVIKRLCKRRVYYRWFFSGSGTVDVVCKQEGYNFIAIEKNNTLYKKSIDRLNGINSNGQTSIFTDFDSL